MVSVVVYIVDFARPFVVVVVDIVDIDHTGAVVDVVVVDFVDGKQDIDFPAMFVVTFLLLPHLSCPREYLSHYSGPTCFL